MIELSSAETVEADTESIAPALDQPLLVPIPRWRLARSWEALKFYLDLVALVIAGALSQTLGDSASPGSGTVAVAAFIALSLAFLAGIRSYRPCLGTSFFDQLAPYVAATAVSTMMVMLAEATVHAAAVPPMDSAVMLWVLSVCSLSVARGSLLLAQNRLYRSGRGLAPTLIVGAGQVGRLAAKRLLESPSLGLRPIGFLDKNPLVLDGVAGDLNLPVLGASWDLEQVVRRDGVEHVVLAYSSAPHGVLLDVVRRCELLGLRVSVVPRLFERMPSHLLVTHFGGLPLLELQPVDPKSVQYSLKYALDRVAAAVALAVLLPSFAVIALTVLLSLGRPILFRQRRVGLDGKEFDMLKFRTMLPASERELEFSELTAPGGIEGEDRRSRAGVFLRRWSLDELPQILNVLKGEMSFVGPRPERPEYVAFFADRVFRYGERHRIKGGLTGWAQIHGLRGQSSIADRVEWDNYYVENFSLLLDLKIILRTIVVVLRGDAL